MADQAKKAKRFRELHVPGQPLLMPNAWDVGSARVLASLGFEALATTSGGFAATLGRLDGHVTREQVIAHAAALCAETEVPISADLEDGFADAPENVAETFELALGTGLAGGSLEDYTGDRDNPIYELELAAERVAAAAEVAHRGPVQLVVTARAENHLRRRDDLDDTIARLRAYEAAGADVLFAPGVVSAQDIARILEAVTVPLSVLAIPGVPPVAELAELGVARVSVGSAFAYAALGAAVDAARELADAGTYGYIHRAMGVVPTARAAFE